MSAGVAKQLSTIDCLISPFCVQRFTPRFLGISMEESSVPEYSGAFIIGI